jgi:hypothetical protein
MNYKGLSVPSPSSVLLFLTDVPQLRIKVVMSTERASAS